MMMVLKTESEIAYVVSTGLVGYANLVQNGKVNPYKGLLFSDNVKVILEVDDRGRIIVKPFIQETSAQPQTAETQVETVVEESVVEPIVEEQPKPKRKRKKKTE